MEDLSPMLTSSSLSLKLINILINLEKFSYVGLSLPGGRINTRDISLSLASEMEGLRGRNAGVLSEPKSAPRWDENSVLQHPRNAFCQ